MVRYSLLDHISASDVCFQEEHEKQELKEFKHGMKALIKQE